MPFSHHPSADANTTQSLPTLQERYALRRCMAETALGKLYWAQDLKQSQSNNEQANVFVFTLLPALAQDPVFEQVLGHVLPTYQKPVPGMPQVSDDGKSADGTRWLVIRNHGGLLLSERLSELDERGMPLPEALELLDSISHLLANQRPNGVFGYLEPNAILLNEKSPCLLTAPVAAALRMSYHTTSNERTHQTLRSGYISPEVLLGGTPTPEDDTFSIACLAYYLLQGSAPFGKYSTLEAAVHNATPSSIRKLRPDMWAALQQGLNLKRVARPKNPATLLKTLERKPQKTLLLPLAGLVAAGAVALTTYQLLTRWSNAPEQPATSATQVQELTPPNTSTAALNPAESVALVNEDATPPALAQENLAAASARQHEATTPQTAVADEITKQAKREATERINAQQAEAEALINTGKLDEASKLLNSADRLITEFTVADSLNRQVSLETALAQAQRKLALEAEPQPVPTPPVASTTPSDPQPDNATSATDTDAANLARAREAIDRGHLSHNEGALDYLEPLLATTPNHPAARELLEKVVDAHQSAAREHLGKRDTEKARAALDESQALISQYQLDKRVEAQIALEKRYREALAMGVFPSGSEPKIADEPETSNVATKPETVTEPVSVTTPDQEHENPEAAEAAEAAAAAANNAPLEVRISPDIPVHSAPTELPPIILDNPPSAPPPDPAASVTFEVPATDSDYNGNTFTPDVPNLIEVPLDTIRNSLPPADR